MIELSIACTSHTLPIVAPLMEVTANQRFRYRSLIGSPIGYPKRFIDVLARQERPGGLRSTSRKNFRTTRSPCRIACKGDGLHLLGSPPRAATKRIENSVPVVFPIEGCHVEHQPRIMTESPAPVLPKS
jgi:hypothetical protein